MKIIELRTIVVCGTRESSSYQMVHRGMSAIPEFVDFNHVAVGRYHQGEESVDAIAFRWVVAHELTASVVPAHWSTEPGVGTDGPGPKRNARQISLWSPNIVGVFAFAGGSGTASMIAHATRAKLPVYLYTTNPAVWKLKG